MEAVATTAVPARWTTTASVAFWRFWQLKLIGSLVFSGLFFFGYFALLKHPVHSVTVMPLLGIDRAIPFQPQAIWVYFSLWFYLELAPGLLTDKRELYSYGVALVLMVAIAFAIFFFWPTQVPQNSTSWIEYAGFAWLKQTDAGGNACPSLHVAFAMFSARWIHFSLGRLRAGAPLKVLNWSWALAITYSTVATRQHVVIDVLAGAALGLAVVALHFNWLRSRQTAAQ